MARCVICDYSDTGDSLSTPREGHISMHWEPHLSGFVCSECALEEDDEFLDDFEDEED